MCIRFDESTKVFTLETANTAYVMKLDFDKYLTHLYYGDKKGVNGPYDAPDFLSFSPYYVEENDGRYRIDTVMSELPQFGSGDLRASAIKVRNANGDSVTLFTYKSHTIFDGRREIPGLPFASASDKSETLEITLEDKVSGCELKLFYTVYPDEDVISRYFTITNVSDKTAKLERAMSIALDIPARDTDVISFPGRHCYERRVQRTPIGLTGIYVTVSLIRSVLEPKLIGRQLNLDPLVTLMVMYAGYKLWGNGGMLLTPMLTVTAMAVVTVILRLPRLSVSG